VQGERASPEGQSAMYQERNPNIGEVIAANPYGGKSFPADES
jgi:hypothetical protein